ncbi:MAG TPA: ArsR family transcriptional regulator [Thermoplasmata archaeon]|nr:ArsR family transcriptional regulator [Thermoplasmata archaeon]
MEEDPLALATRRRLYDAVRRAPGIGGREVQRATELGWGETVYHLERLTDSGLLHRESDGHQDHYFVATVPLADRRLLGLTRSPSARKLLVVLLDGTERTVPELVERTGLSAGRLSVHLRRLIETGLVATGRRGRLRTFSPIDRERLIRLLIAYRDGFADRWMERMLETWSELFRP